LELLSGEKVLPKPTANPRFPAQKLENIASPLNFLKKKGIEVKTSYFSFLPSFLKFHIKNNNK